jgi:hypothetical protein
LLTARFRATELEDGLTSGQGDVLVEVVIDPEAKGVEDRDRWPVHRTDDGADQPRSRKRCEQLAEEPARRIRSELGRVICLRFAFSGDHGLPGGSEIADPVNLR